MMVPLLGQHMTQYNKFFVFDGNDKVNFSPVLTAGDDTYTIEAYFKATQQRGQVVVEQNSSSQIGSRRACMLLLGNGQGDLMEKVMTDTM